jgi:hypothetical protein
MFKPTPSPHVVTLRPPLAAPLAETYTHAFLPCFLEFGRRGSMTFYVVIYRKMGQMNMKTLFMTVCTSVTGFIDNFHCTPVFFSFPFFSFITHCNFILGPPITALVTVSDPGGGAHALVMPPARTKMSTLTPLWRLRLVTPSPCRCQRPSPRLSAVRCLSLLAFCSIH